MGAHDFSHPLGHKHLHSASYLHMDVKYLPQIADETGQVWN
jgi:hypothetical protein